VLIAGAVAIMAYLFVPRYFYVTADALVRGDLVPVTSLYRARIERLLVQCDDRVRAGQQLAVVSNFLVQADYQRQLEQSAAQLSLSIIALDQGVSAARADEEAARAKYAVAQIQARRLEAIFREYDQAYRGGGIGRAEWEAQRGEGQAAVAAVGAAREALNHARVHVQRIDADQRARIASGRAASDRVRGLVQRSGSESVLAPVSGYIVNCTDRPQNVVDPGVPVFAIFEPDRAYVLAYFDPTSVQQNVRVGQTAQIAVPGLSQTVSGRVRSIYPELANLPGQLTRYFWQHVQWSEYRPVRIALDGVPRDVRWKLPYNAQVRVRIPIRANWPTFGLLGQSTGR